MTTNEDWVAAVIAAHPEHQIIGRTRLQKTIKLLQRLELPTDYVFSLHFYGPYSEDLQSDIGLLEMFGVVEEKPQSNQKGDPYYIIQATPDPLLPNVSRWQPAIKIMAEADPTVLELAATYDAFRERGANDVDAMQKLRQKKGKKCDNGNDEKALALLDQLGLLKLVVAA